MRIIEQTTNSIYQFFVSPNFGIRKAIIFLLVSFERLVKNDSNEFIKTPESDLIPEKSCPITDEDFITEDLKLFQEANFDWIEVAGLQCKYIYQTSQIETPVFDEEGNQLYVKITEVPTLNEQGNKIYIGVAFPAYSYIMATKAKKLLPEILAIADQLVDGLSNEAIASIKQELLSVGEVMIYNRIKDQVEGFIWDNELYKRN